MNNPPIEERRLHILIGFLEIGGYHGALRKGFVELGHHCDFVCYVDHPFKYENGRSLGIAIAVRKLLKLRDNTKNPILGAAITIIRLGLQFLFFLFACIRYDVFIFGFGSTFFTPITPSFEKYRIFGSAFLKKVGKKVIFLMQGSDARPPFMDGSFQHLSIEQLVQMGKTRLRQVRDIQNSSTAVVCDRAIAAYFDKPIIDRSFILCPAHTSHAANSQAVRRPYGKSETIRILHAPSAPRLKGSDVIAATIKGLRVPGKRVEYCEIRDKSNREVISALEACDLVVDQLYSDIILPIFPTEAAYLGKCAIIGMYDQKFIFRGIPKNLIPPAFYTHPEQLGHTLRKVLRYSKAKLYDRGQQMRQFALKYLTEKRVAEKFVQIIDDQFPEYWYYDPAQYDYVNGCVITEAKQFGVIRDICNQFSFDALLMKDKPLYLQRLLMKRVIGSQKQSYS